MICPKCGIEYPDTEPGCPRCDGGRRPAVPREERPSLVPALTLACIVLLAAAGTVLGLELTRPRTGGTMESSAAPATTTTAARTTTTAAATTSTSPATTTTTTQTTTSETTTTTTTTTEPPTPGWQLLLNRRIEAAVREGGPNMRYEVIDLNSDGFDDLVVSEDDAHVSACTIWVFSGSDYVQLATPEGETAFGSFGVIAADPSRKLILSEWCGMGIYTAQVYRVEGSTAVLQAAYKNSMDAGEEEDAVCTFNGETVTPEQYETLTAPYQTGFTECGRKS